MRLLPEGIKSATEEIYAVDNNQKKLLHKKEMVFTRNGRIKYSKTVDSLGNLLQETEKKLWFVVERYPNKEPYYNRKIQISHISKPNFLFFEQNQEEPVHNPPAL